jgi:hypothetical protein
VVVHFTHKQQFLLFSGKSSCLDLKSTIFKRFFTRFGEKSILSRMKIFQNRSPLPPPILTTSRGRCNAQADVTQLSAAFPLFQFSFPLFSAFRNENSAFLTCGDGNPA